MSDRDAREEPALGIAANPVMNVEAPISAPAIRPEQALRRPNGTFKKGVSGNPRGRSKPFADLQTAARSLAPDALRVLAEIMVNERSPAAARVAAASAVLDRGYGRPSTAVIYEERKPSPEEEERSRELINELVRTHEETIRRAHEMEQRALDAERRLTELELL